MTDSIKPPSIVFIGPGSTRAELENALYQHQRRQAINAARWEALISCDRIRFFGWAGLDVDGRPIPGRNGDVHFGADFWTHHPVCEDSQTTPLETRKRVLTAFADAAIERQRAAEVGTAIKPLLQATSNELLLASKRKR